MAHFAKIDKDNKVLAVHVVNNDIATDEQAGIDFLNSLYPNNNLKWVQTSYNASIRKNYAGIGYTYDTDKDAFIAPKPYASWTLNNTTCKWEAPVSFPTDEKIYKWDEDTTNWKEIT